MSFVLAQVDTAIDLATREWTIAGFAILVWLLTCGFFIWLLRRMAKRWDADVSALVKARNEREDGWRQDLQAQIIKRGEDAERVEQGLADSAAAIREQTAIIADLAPRLTAIEARSETVDRRTEAALKAAEVAQRAAEAALKILERRAHPREERPE